MVRPWSPTDLGRSRAWELSSVTLTGDDRFQLRAWHGFTGDEDPPAKRKPDHGSFVLVVKLSGGRYRRRCFLTVAAAERAAHNAQAAGHDAQVFLAELKPLWRLAGGTVAS